MIFSLSTSGTRLTIGLPRELREPCEDVIVRVGDEHAVDEIVFLRRRGLLAAAAAALGAVFRDRLRLHVAAVGKRHHHVRRCDQVLQREVHALRHDFRAALVAELVADRGQFVADDFRQARRLGEDIDEIDDEVHHFLVLAGDFFTLEPREPLQPQFQDRLRLRVGQPVAFRAPAEFLRQPVGTRRIRSRAPQHFLDNRRAPRLRHQCRLGLRRRRRRLDQRDDLVDVRQGDGQAFENVSAFARAPQLEARAAHDHFAPVDEEEFEELLEIEDARLAVDQRDHVHPEAVLQLCELEQVVLDDLRHLAALQLDHHAHAGLVRLVAQVGNALEFLLADELADPDEQIRLVHLVRDLVDDDRLATALVDLLDVRACAYHNAAAAGAVAFADTLLAIDDSRGRKIGSGNDLHQFVDRDVRVRKQREAGRNRFRQVVRRNVGRHAHGNAGRPVDEQVGQPRRQDGRLQLLAVVIRKSTVSLSISARSSEAIFCSRHSVYRYAAAESPSTDPKLPWPSING